MRCEESASYLIATLFSPTRDAVVVGIDRQLARESNHLGDAS